MDTESQELYFQKLQEFILDDDKIVTVPFLARNLGISLADSQRLISKYVEDQRKLNRNHLSVTYTVMGTLKNGKGDSIVMFDDSNIGEKEALFDKIHSDIIFSVQKNSNVDFNIIALVDKFDASEITDEPLPGSIIGRECTKRNLKLKKLPTPPPPTIKGKSAMFMPKTDSSKSSEDFPSKKPESKGSTAIADMFNKAPASKSTQKEEKKVSAKDTKSTNKGKGTLSNFFSQSSTKSSFGSNDSSNGKSGSKSSLTNGTSSAEISKEDEIDVTEFMEVDFQEDPKPVENEKENEAEMVTKTGKKEKKEKKKSSTKQKRGRSQDDPEEKSTKRRKRIVERNDSDSDDLFGNESNEEDVIEKSDEETERAPPPIIEKQQTVKGKIRKAVDKTYLDKEGFLVTTTEYEYVSASEDETPEPVKETPTPKPLEKKNSASSNDASPKTTAKTKKGKKNAPAQNQPTLMNFFKKK